MNPLHSKQDLLAWQSRFQGLLLGTAVGDALGLPAEGLSPQRIKRLWGSSWEHRFLAGHGMISDDTEHTLFVAQSLLQHPNDPIAFQRSLAWKLRFWLLGAPAGIGLATLRAILKLWCGFPPHSSGVHSAGNGPSMRSAILGAFFSVESKPRAEFVRLCCHLTHTDPRAQIAAQAVAEAAAWTINHNGQSKGFLAALPSQGAADNEWQQILERMILSLARGHDTIQFACQLGLSRGVSGYCYHSVPVALYAWLRYPDNFRAALESALNCGGDTDTVGAMTGALAGASVGVEGIPSVWLKGLIDWPRSRRVLVEVANRLAEQRAKQKSQGPVTYFWPGLVLRNTVFLGVVLSHGLRRFLPPY